jgi:hypothetical protein
MAKKRILRRGLYFLVGILVGAPLMLVGFATDAHARHHHGTHAVHFVPPGTTAPMLKRDAANGPRPPHDRGAPRTVGAPPNTLIGTGAGKGGKQPSGDSTETGTGAPAKDANAPDFHTKDLEPIDTRITVQPRLHGAEPGTVRQAKSKIGPVGSRHPYTPHAFTPGKAAHITRNAIGLQIAPRSVAPTHNAGLVRSPTDAAPGFAPNGNDGVAKSNSSLDHFAVPHPNPVVIGTGASRPAINGNGFVRRGFVPATLGGPAKNVVIGIDGSTIRPKH